MSDKPKTIQEALAEVQRLVNIQKEARIAEIVADAIQSNDTVDEGIVSDVVKTVASGVAKAKNLGRNFSRGIKGERATGMPADPAKYPGKSKEFVKNIGTKATDVEKKVNVLGKNAGKITATAGATTTAGALSGKSGSPSTPKTNTPAKPAIDSSAKGAKYAGGKSHYVTHFDTKDGKPSIGKVTSEKGWSDAGAVENRSRRETGAIQSIRTNPETKKREIVTPSAGSKDEKSTQSFLKKQGVGVSEGIVKDVIVKGMSKYGGMSSMGGKTAFMRSTPSAAPEVSSLAGKAKDAISSTVSKVKADPVGAAKKVATGAAVGTVGGMAGGAAVDAAKSSSTPSSTTSSATTTDGQKKQSFGQAFAAARKAAGGSGGKFTFNGKTYNTAVKGEKVKSVGKLRNMNPKGPAMEEIESPLVMSFLELMDTNHGNMFEAAKHLSPKQKKIASVAGDPNKIDAEDFKVLRAKKVEEAMDSDVIGGGTVTKDKKTVVSPTAPKAATAPTASDKKALDAKVKSIAKEEYSLEDFVEYHLQEGYDINDIANHIEENYQLDELSKKTLASYVKKASHDVATRSAETRGGAMKADEARKNKDIDAERKHEKHAKTMFDKSWKRRGGIAKAVDKLAKEEVEFSDSEIEFINSIMNTEGDNE